MYINVTDAKGLQMGCDSTVFKPSYHRLLIEDNTVWGADNIMGHFRDGQGRFNTQEWQMFLQLIMALPTGEYRDLSWQHE